MIKHKFMFSVAASLAIVAGGGVALHAEEVYEIAEVNVDANATRTGGTVSTTNDSQGATTLSREAIQAKGADNGSIISAIRTIPSVQVSANDRRGLASADINPAKISINGAKFYQTNFTLDGVNVNNNLNPARQWQSGYDWMPEDFANAQGVYVDTDLIDEITVYDSDISAKFGNFQGGVVDAKTRNPRTDGFHGKISFSHTNGDWTHQIIPYYYLKKYNDDGTPNMNYFYGPGTNRNGAMYYAPDFDKYITRITLEGPITENFGLMFAFTDTRSYNHRKRYSTEDGVFSYLKYKPDNIDWGLGEKYDNVQTTQNFMLKGVWYVNDRLTITPSLSYTPHKEQTDNEYDYTFGRKREFESGGWDGSLKVEYDADFGKITNLLSYTSLQQTRNSDPNYPYLINWRPSPKIWWGSDTQLATEQGAAHSMVMKQKTYTWNLDFEFNEFDIKNTKHEIIAGLQLQQQRGTYTYPYDSFTGSVNQVSTPGFKCKDGDDIECDDTEMDLRGTHYYGQYVYSKIVRKAGSVGVDMFTASAYLEDKITWGKWTFRPGVRVDHNDFMDETTIAPRFTTTYDLFGDKSTIFSAGYNRYYAQSIFSMALFDKREKGLHQTWSKYPCDGNWRQASYDNEWQQCTASWSYDYGINKLKTPYDDEYSLGVKQILGNYEFGIKYIKRLGRKGIVKADSDYYDNAPDPSDPEYGSWYYFYANDGRTNKDIINITARTLDPIKFGPTENTFEFGFEYIRTKKDNYTDYDTTNRTSPDRVYYLNGVETDYADLPKDDFARPWTASLNIVTKIPSWHVTWSNLFQLKSGAEGYYYKKYISNTASSDGKRHYYMKKFNLGTVFTWDTRISWEKDVYKGVSAFVNLDVYNVLNRKNPYYYGTDTGNGYDRATGSYDYKAFSKYETGRQFWLEVGVKW